MKNAQSDLDGGRVQFETRTARRDDQPAGFGGRAPKGYRRNDERIRVALCEALIDSDAIDPTEVGVEVRDATVVLTGTISNESMRQAIEQLAADSVGVARVDNRIRLERNAPD